MRTISLAVSAYFVLWPLHHLPQHLGVLFGGCFVLPGHLCSVNWNLLARGNLDGECTGGEVNANDLPEVSAPRGELLL